MLEVFGFNDTVAVTCHGLLMSGFRLISRSTAVAQILRLFESSDVKWLAFVVKKTVVITSSWPKKTSVPHFKELCKSLQLNQMTNLDSSQATTHSCWWVQKAPLTATMLTSLCSSRILHKLSLISPWTRPRFWWKCVNSRSRPLFYRSPAVSRGTLTPAHHLGLFFCGCV